MVSLDVLDSSLRLVEKRATESQLLQGEISLVSFRLDVATFSMFVGSASNCAVVFAIQ